MRGFKRCPIISMVRHHLMVHPLTIWAPSQKPMNAQGHPYHSFSISLHCPLFSKLPTNRDELQSTMNATIVTICNLLQTLLPQSKVIATIELLQMQTLHSNHMLQLQQHDYTIMHYCKTPLLQSNVKAMHCHKTLTFSSQIKICSIDPKINLKKANGKELACQETL